MPRNAKVKDKPAYIYIARNRITERPIWKPPKLLKRCDCKQVDGVSCAVGCAMKQQRHECTAKCTNKSCCVNRVIQRKLFYPTERIVDCGGRGSGLMFTRDVPENVIALEYRGEIITEGTARRRLQFNKGDHTYACGIVSGWVVDSCEYGNEARWINSSHEPNAVLETWWVGNTPHVVVRTLRALRAGEEILVDYNFAMDDSEPCLCGSIICSGWIGRLKKGESAPVDPFTYDEPEQDQEIQPVFSRSAKSTFQQYNLRGAKVKGDGHCLFSSVAYLECERTMKEWRKAVVADMRAYCTTPELKRQYLVRANNDSRIGLPPFRTFEAMLEGFEDDDWGNGDCIRHIARLLGKGVLVFTQGSVPNYCRWETDTEPADTIILYNSKCPATHKLVHFDPVWASAVPTTSFLSLLQELKLQKRANLQPQTEEPEVFSSDPEVSDAESMDNEARELALGGSSSTGRVMFQHVPAHQGRSNLSAPTGSVPRKSKPMRSRPNPTVPSPVVLSTSIAGSRIITDEVSMLQPIPDAPIIPASSSRLLNTVQAIPVRPGILPTPPVTGPPTDNGTRVKAQGRRPRKYPPAARSNSASTSRSDFDPTRLIFRDKLQPRPQPPARSHWGLMYFMYKMQAKQRSTWDLKSLEAMALHPKISPTAAASLWEIGWQETIDNSEMPELGVAYDHMDTENMLSLWWSAHLWACDVDEGTRTDLIMASANVGPVGIWPSIHTTVKEMASHRAGIIRLDDLRISQRSVPSLRSSLNFVYPQYHVCITSHSASEWEEGTHGRRRQKYHYAMATLLHRHLYTTISSISICGKNKTERAAVLGHSQVISTYCKPLERKVIVVGLYQHTSAFPERQQLLYDCLERFLRTVDKREVSLIGSGDLNAAFSNQRWDYESQQHGRSDVILQEFAERKLVQFEKLSQPTNWSHNHAARATLDHVFSGDSNAARLSVVPRHSWHPSHDHANLYVWGNTKYLPGRPAAGAYRAPAPRVRMRAWEDKKPQWAALSKEALDYYAPEPRYDMDPASFQDNFKRVVGKIVDAGVDLVGRTSPGSNRPAFRTQEVTTLVHDGRLLSAAKRETHRMNAHDERFTAAQQRALAFLEIPTPSLPISSTDLEYFTDRLSRAYKETMTELKQKAGEMDRENIKEAVEKARQDLGNERFSVKKALGKIGATSTLDILEQRVPIGFEFVMSPSDLESTLREHNLEEVVPWIEVIETDRCTIRAPTLKLILPLLTRVPLYVKPSAILWEIRSAQEDQHKLWIMDHHYQQISYAKKAKCPCCDGNRPLALPLRMNGDVGVVDYCQDCFKVSEFVARASDYEDITFLGNVVSYRTVPEGERLAGKVTYPEFQKYLAKLKEKKAAGFDRFHVEFVKYAHDDFKKYVFHLINLYLEQEVMIDEDFLLGQIRLLFKKEPATNLRNWRPICLLQMIYKLLSLILNDRLYEMVERHHLLEGSQEGFRKLRGTGRQGQSLAWLFDRARRKGDKLYCVYADFVSVFDSPDHPALLRALKAYGIPDAELLASLYRASPFRVVTPFGETADIRVTRGCRQGCILSPLVFDLFVNLLLRHLNASGVGAQITERRKVNHKAFADDIGMVVHTPDAAQNLLNRLAAFCNWSGMEVNMLKTQATAIDFHTGDTPSDLRIESTAGANVLSNRRSKARDVCSLTFAGDRIDFVPPSTAFCYLGFDLALTGDWKSEVAKIMQKTTQLCEVLDRHKFSESQGLYLFQCSAISTFQYSVGVAAWTTKQLHDLTLLWIRAVKNALHLSRGVSRSLIVYPVLQGGMQFVTPFTVGFKEVGAHLTRCSTYQDSLSLQLDDVINEALSSTLTLDLHDLRESIKDHPPSDISNTIVRWVHLSVINGVDIEWDRIRRRQGALSWASVLRSVKDEDVHWSQDEIILRRTARALYRNGHSNVLSLPVSDHKICIPYGPNYTESARRRLEQWTMRLLCVRETDSLQLPGRVSEHRRSCIEMLDVIDTLLSDVTSFSPETVSEFMSVLELSLEHNPDQYSELYSAVLEQRPRSWMKLRRTFMAILFPATVKTPRRSTRPTTNWEQIRRYADILFPTVLSIRRNNTAGGWHLRCELAGRTVSEKDVLLALPETRIRHKLVKDRLPILLPREWWPEEEPPTVWGWWVLPVDAVDDGVRVRFMERHAISAPSVVLPIRGEGSVEYALNHMCLPKRAVRWVQFLDLGVPMRSPRIDENDSDLPRSILNFLATRGPLTPSELLPGGHPKVFSRLFRGSTVPSLRPHRHAYVLQVEPDELDDSSVIQDPERLLQYHVGRFRRATRTPVVNQKAPATIWGRSRASGVDVRAHSFIDGAPPRLNPDLVSVHSLSAQYHDFFRNLVATTYQGVTRIDDTLGTFELDAMRFHQLKHLEPDLTSQFLRDHVRNMQTAENRGYRTINWTIMRYLTETFKLDVSMGEPLLGLYPSLAFDGSFMTKGLGNVGPRNWLFLDAVPQIEGITWCDRFLHHGGGVIASTSIRNMTSETSKFLSHTACVHGSVMTKNLLRVKHWWKSGDTKTANSSKTLYLWVFSDTDQSRTLHTAMKWISSASRHTLPALGVNGRAWTYWSGSEAGRIGLYDGNVNLLATDGSAANGKLGSGFTLRRHGAITDWHGFVEGADEQITSFRPEAAALLAGLRAVPRADDFDGIVDNESLLTVTQAWIGRSHHPAPASIADSDIILPMILELGLRTGRSRLWKEKSHRGEPFNTRADALADLGTTTDNHSVIRAVPRRILYHVPGYSGVWSSKVSRHAETTAASMFLERFSDGVLDVFLSRPDMGRQYLGNWWKRRGKLSDTAVRIVTQIVSDTYPSPFKLFMWGKAATASCGECGFPYGTTGHIQGHCGATKDIRIKAHNKCRALVTECIQKHARGWTTYPEMTVADTINKVNRLTGSRVPIMPTVRFLDPKLHGDDGTNGRWRDLHWSESQHMRIDEFAIQISSKSIRFNEMTRAWDRYPDFHLKKHQFKTAWYLPIIQHFVDHLSPRGWDVAQLNFTVGARASIPESEWRSHLSQFSIARKHQDTLLQEIADSVLQSLVDVAGAYVSHRTTRLQMSPN